MSCEQKTVSCLTPSFRPVVFHAVAFAVVITLLRAFPAVAGENAGVHEHDEMMVRFALGGGYGGGYSSCPDTGMLFHGPGSMMNVAFGYAVVENLIVNIDLFGTVMGSPHTKSDSSWEPSNAEFELVGAGLGVTWYRMPQNMFVAGSVGWSAWQGSGKLPAPLVSSGGPALNLLAGKEWWIERNWGVGAAFNLVCSSVPDARLQDRAVGQVTSLSAGLLVTLTYN